MLKIGDFSRIGQVSIRTLRHYDELGLLTPSRVDPMTQYRFYDLEQLPKLHRIMALKELGFSLEQIAAALHDKQFDETQFIRMLLDKQQEIDKQISDWQQRLNRVVSRIRQLQDGDRFDGNEVIIKRIEPCFLASIRRTVPSLQEMGSMRCSILNDLYGFLSNRQITATELEAMIYHNPDYVEEHIDMEAAVQLNAKDFAKLRRVDNLPSELLLQQTAPLTVASTLHEGSMWEIYRPMRTLLIWAKENGFECSGPFKEVHLFGKESELLSPEQVVMEVQICIDTV